MKTLSQITVLLTLLAFTVARAQNVIVTSLNGGTNNVALLTTNTFATPIPFVLGPSARVVTLQLSFSSLGACRFFQINNIQNPCTNALTNINFKVGQKLPRST